jgi:hypothetical protein
MRRSRRGHVDTHSPEILEAGHQGRDRPRPDRLVASPVLASVALLTGCAAVVGSAVVTAATGVAASAAREAVYSGALRIKIEDVSTLPEDVARQIRDVRLDIPQAESVYTAKGKVSGLACQLSTGHVSSGRRWWPRPSEANGMTPEDIAITQLKLSAFRAGGNAVVSWSCVHNGDVDWLNNCFESWVSTGVAVRFADD